MNNGDIYYGLYMPGKNSLQPPSGEIDFRFASRIRDDMLTKYEINSYALELIDGKSLPIPQTKEFNHRRYRTEVRGQLGLVDHYLAQRAVAENVAPFLDGNLNIVGDIGFGEGLEYPFPSFPEQTQYVLFEPSQEAVESAIRELRISRGEIAQHITAKSPPYNSVSDNSLDSVLSFSVLHIFPPAQLRSILTDIARCLKHGKPLFHLQQSNFVPSFLEGVDSELLERMAQKIQEKYPDVPFMSTGNPLNAWLKYSRARAKALRDRLIKNGLDERFSSLISRFPRVSGNDLDDSTSPSLTSSIEADLGIKPNDSAVVRFLKTASGLLTTLIMIDPKKYDDSMLSQTRDLMFDCGGLHHDILDAALLCQMEDAGLYPKSITVSILQEVDGPPGFTMTADGQKFFIKTGNREHVYYSEGRVVMGFKMR